ncbi:phosphatidylserine decarboxylase protein [Rutstroemia sp. NJR-2017a BBW]|nr:phosphatidylserine decarboxylase protein [Rutstroemia sp. NJR-2017a BBW]
MASHHKKANRTLHKEGRLTPSPPKDRKRSREVETLLDDDHLTPPLGKRQRTSLDLTVERSREPKLVPSIDGGRNTLGQRNILSRTQCFIYLQGGSQRLPFGVNDRSRAPLTTGSNTPSDQKPREEKTAPYLDPRYKTLLETKDTTCNAKLECLIESVNEGWNNAVPLTGTRPQPDYSVGFKREAFTGDQLDKISPFIGDFITGDQSFFMTLDVADRQNAHSMTLAVRAIVELFRLAKREKELHRQILAFSISHDHWTVRIYSHYPVIKGKDTAFYRHPIRIFGFTELEGKEKWSAYKFTKNIYDIWMPKHLERIRSVIDELPSDFDFEVPLLPEEYGLSQNLESHHLSRSFTEPESLPGERGSQWAIVDAGDITPDTSFTGQGVSKKPRRNAVNSER